MLVVPNNTKDPDQSCCALPLRDRDVETTGCHRHHALANVAADCAIHESSAWVLCLQ